MASVAIAEYGTSFVSEELGRWAVFIMVVFPDETILRRISDYHDERRATIAASLIHRAMNRSRI